MPSPSPAPHATPRPSTPRASLLLFSLAGPLLLGSCADEPRPRGVLLISVDSLRADHLSCYGYRSRTRPGIATTPSIDRLLADQGALFENTISTTSWTLPSHMAMLTGLPNELHGVLDIPDRLHASRHLLQERLQSAGFQTAGFWSGPNLHPWFGFARGFDEYVDCSGGSIADPDVFGVEQAGDQEQVMALHNASHEGITGPVVVEAFDKWFEGVDEDEQFFAFVHFWDVHYDYTPPPQHDVFYPEYTGEVDGREFRHLDLVVDPDDPKDLDRIISLYDGEIRFTDRNVAAVLEVLAHAGRLDDTLVVFTADHGEEFIEHGQLGHKNSLFEEVLRVPLIMRWPEGIPAGARIPEFASLIDIAPTILDFLGDWKEGDLWGRSLRPALEGERLPQRWTPIELTSRYVDLDARGAHDGRAKILNVGPGDGMLLIDLVNDPGELRLIPRKGLPLGDDDPRIQAVRRLWWELEREAALLERVTGDVMPDSLTEDLDKTGYMGDSPEVVAPPGPGPDASDASGVNGAGGARDAGAGRPPSKD